MILILISLITRDVNHLFLCLLVICTSVLEKVICPILNRILLLYEFFTYFGYQTLIGSIIYKYLLPFRCLPFCFCDTFFSFFAVQKPFSLIFAFVSLTFGVKFTKTPQKPKSISVCFFLCILLGKVLDSTF